MSNIIIPKILTTEEKIAQMKEDAKFEIVGDFDAEDTALACAARVEGRPAAMTAPKVMLSGECVFNCAYCGCRCSREDRGNYTCAPKELADIAFETAKKSSNAVFITSAIYKNADYTQELLAETARILREDLWYRGYLHAKIMPGADPLLVEKTGRYASRMSVNIEVAQSSGYNKIAKQKTRENILNPMGEIANRIKLAKLERRKFAINQTTQLMAGSTDEDDRVIMNLSDALYKKYRLKRVYYTAFKLRGIAKGYENENLEIKNTPYWRMARLYQADRLLQLYDFTPDDITPEEDPFLHEDIDPKAAWALRHLDLYPIEVNKADYETLIRIPGIGITYAKRIIEARKYCTITHDLLKKMKVAMKRSIYFITCNGKYEGGTTLDSPELRAAISTGMEQMSIWQSLTDDGMKC